MCITKTTKVSSHLCYTEATVQERETGKQLNARTLLTKVSDFTLVLKLPFIGRFILADEAVH